LRETIKQAPDPWKILKTLRPETRAKLIDFVDSGDHLNDELWDAAEDDTESDLFNHSDNEESAFNRSRYSTPGSKIPIRPNKTVRRVL
jgi:hypothetical protein